MEGNKAVVVIDYTQEGESSLNLVIKLNVFFMDI